MSETNNKKKEPQTFEITYATKSEEKNGTESVIRYSGDNIIEALKEFADDNKYPFEDMIRTIKNVRYIAPNYGYDYNVTVDQNLANFKKGYTATVEELLESIYELQEDNNTLRDELSEYRW